MLTFTGVLWRGWSLLKLSPLWLCFFDSLPLWRSKWWSSYELSSGVRSRREGLGVVKSEAQHLPPSKVPRCRASLSKRYQQLQP